MMICYDPRHSTPCEVDGCDACPTECDSKYWMNTDDNPAGHFKDDDK